MSDKLVTIIIKPRPRIIKSQMLAVANEIENSNIKKITNVKYGIFY